MRLLNRLRRKDGGEGSRTLRVWICAAVLVSVLAVTAHEDFGALRYSIGALVVGGFLFSWERRHKRNRWVKAILTVGCLAASWSFLRGLAADPYHTSVPLTVFLLWLQTLHSFDLPHRRDLLFSLLSSAILMSVAAAFSIDHGFAVYILPYVVAVCVALVYNTAEAEANDAVLVDAVPASSSRLAVKSGLLGWREVTAATGRVLTWLAVAAGIVYLLTPRLPGYFVLSLPFTPRVPIDQRLHGEIVNPSYPGSASGDQVFNPNGYFGFSTTVDLGLRGRLTSDVVMRVRTTERRNWRALVFDTYTGRGWTISDHHVVEHAARTPPIELVQGRDDIYAYRHRGERLIQTFYIDRPQPNIVFGVPRIERIYLPGNFVYVDRYSAVRLPFTLKPGMIYTVVSRPLAASVDQLMASGFRYPHPLIRERYLQLPPDLPPRVLTLAREITEGAQTPYDRVTAVNRYLWKHYEYDLTIGPQRRRGDAVDYFLFEERRGYCEQFASAMVVLLRAAGVPARLVTGYTGGTYNPLTGLVEIRNTDAHAWVEVFFSEVGWVEFEPTPGFRDPVAQPEVEVPRWGWAGLAEFVQARLTWRPPFLGMVGSSALRGPTVLLWGGAVLLAVGLVILSPVVMRSLRRVRGPFEVVLDAYALVLRSLARRGFRPRPSDTPREIAAKAESVSLPEGGRIATLVEQSFFGRSGPSANDSEEAERLRSALKRRVSSR